MKYNQAGVVDVVSGWSSCRPISWDFLLLVQAWPKEDKPLGRKDREELQRLLLAEGILKGDVDGVIGRRTIAAVQRYQSRTWPASGWLCEL